MIKKIVCWIYWVKSLSFFCCFWAIILRRKPNIMLTASFGMWLLELSCRWHCLLQSKEFKVLKRIFSCSWRDSSNSNMREGKRKSEIAKTISWNIAANKHIFSFRVDWSNKKDFSCSREARKGKHNFLYKKYVFNWL